LNPEGTSEADLTARTLTNLCSERPNGLVMAHATLVRAVWAAYGWDDPDLTTVEDDVTLSRLLALNQQGATVRVLQAARG
jgi:hypothetical protein